MEKRQLVKPADTEELESKEMPEDVQHANWVIAYSNNGECGNGIFCGIEW